MQRYPGLIDSDNGKYSYSAEMYWNIAEHSTFKAIDDSGRMPEYERLKVYIFAGHEAYLEEPENLLADLQKNSAF